MSWMTKALEELLGPVGRVLVIEITLQARHQLGIGDTSNHVID
jgi:hypothetical protein